MAAQSTVWPENQAHSDKLEVTEDLTIQIWGYKTNGFKNGLCLLLYVLSLGFVRLFFYWKPNWHVWATCDPCSLNVADQLLIQDEHRTMFLRPVKHLKSSSGYTLILPNGVFDNVNVIRYFTLRKVIFVWYTNLNVFHRVFDLDENVSAKIIYDSLPLNETEVKRRLAVYGPNEIAVNLTPLHILLFKEVLNPFYLFQVFSVCVWYSENYNIYASIIIAISLLSISVNIYQTRKNQKTLRNMMYSTSIVKVVRKSFDDVSNETSTMDVDSTKLVVGDILVIPPQGYTMECDCVLISGDCVVNESMLTGESVPITKTPLSDDATFSTKTQAKSTLFCGTKVLLTRQKPGLPVKALVVRTGFNTSKGRLVCSILYPKPVDFAFTKDLLLFIAVLAGVAAIGFFYTLILMGLRGNGAGKIIQRALDIVTIVIPPFLPAAMTIGIIAAERRLKKSQIFCISPSTINTCGAITCVCFDKTGTLTEDGLDLMGILPADLIRMDATLSDLTTLNKNSPFVTAMACCHSLSLINGEIAGDPMDLILFNESGWALEEATLPAKQQGQEDWTGIIVKSDDDNGTKLKCLKQFAFSSQLRRMSIIVQNVASDDGSYFLYCKGAPETVADLCLSQSVSKDFLPVLNYYAKRGYRVLGLAYRELNQRAGVLKESRDSLEMQMTFLGLVVFENRLKPQTTPIIRELKEARIRTVMITGDNLLTAVSVAKECGVLDNARPIYILEAVDNDGDGVRLRVQKTSEDKPLSPRLSVTKIDRPLDLEKGSSFFEAQHADYQLAIEGSSLRLITQSYPHMVPTLISVCSVYARMAPEQKVQVVSGFQEIDYIVAMCGDGANDCGALKAAHAGISLSEAEASIASPFTSKNANIACVPTIIREGRSALVTSFGIFKYMVCYSLTQFLSVIMLYWIGSTLSDYQFLYIDLFITTTFMTFFGFTGPCVELAKKPPPMRLLSWASFWSVFLQMSLVLAIQIFVYKIVEIQPWFVPFVDPGEETNYFSYQGTALFIVSLYQYISLMVVFSKSHPYRRTVFSNIFLTVSLVICTSLSLWFSLKPPEKVQQDMNMKIAPTMKFRWFLLFVAAFDVLLAILFETFFIEYLFNDVVEPSGHCTSRKRPKYANLIDRVGRDSSSLLMSKDDVAPATANEAKFSVRNVFIKPILAIFCK